MANQDWFEEASKEYVPGVFGYRKIAEKYGLSVKTVESRFRTWKIKNIIFQDKKPEPTPDNIYDYYEKLKQLDKSIDTMDTKQTKTHVKLDDHKPVGIAFTGDWHTGEHGIDYKQMDEDRELITGTEGVYAILMGDYKGNYKPTKHPSGTYTQVASPSMQDLLIKEFFDQYKGTALAAITGCHDQWDFAISGRDLMTEMCSIAKCVNLWHGGGINIELGNQQYKIRARHKFKGESDLNTTNTQRRLLNFFGPCDVICVAHKHYPDMQQSDKMGQDVIYLRSGSYKVYDEFGQQLGGYEGKAGVSIVILYPDEKKIVPFKNLRDGITHLQAVRSAYDKSMLEMPV
jgi:hypothetical protein